MSLKLCIRANSFNIFKSYNFNKSWNITGTPIYTTENYPANIRMDDSFYLKYGDYLVSPPDPIFNLHQKSFTITWWEYANVNSPDLGTMQFSSNLQYPYVYLLLGYNGRIGGVMRNIHYAKTTSNTFSSWDIFEGLYAGDVTTNTWTHNAFVSKYENGAHTFITYRNGQKLSSITTTNTFPDVGNEGKLYIGIYDVAQYANKYFQDIRFYDECLFTDNSFDYINFTLTDHYNNNIINNLKIGE